MLLQNAAREREVRARSGSQQRWFRDRAPDAERALRDLVGTATGSVLICDPYFGGEDLRRVVLAIANPATEVRVLTSAMHLKRGDEAALLNRRLEEARAAPPINPIEIRVMRGRAPPIHDRFISTTKVMWALGSSINRFGERGTLMMHVPNRKEVEDVRSSARRTAAAAPS